MRGKSTVYSPSMHEQYRESGEELMQKRLKEESVKLKQSKQGLSSFKVQKSIKKQKA